MTTTSAQSVTASTMSTSTLGQVRGTLVQDFTVTAKPSGKPRFLADPPSVAGLGLQESRPTTASRQLDLWWVPWIIAAVFFLVAVSLWSNTNKTPVTPSSSSPTSISTPAWPSRECGGGLQTGCAISLAGGQVKLRGGNPEQEALYKCVRGGDLTDNCDLLAATSMKAPFSISITRANGRSGPITHIQRP